MERIKEKDDRIEEIVAKVKYGEYSISELRGAMYLYKDEITTYIIGEVEKLKKHPKYYFYGKEVEYGGFGSFDECSICHGDSYETGCYCQVENNVLDEVEKMLKGEK